MTITITQRAPQNIGVKHYCERFHSYVFLKICNAWRYSLGCHDNLIDFVVFLVSFLNKIKFFTKLSSVEIHKEHFIENIDS